MRSEIDMPLPYEFFSLCLGYKGKPSILFIEMVDSKEEYEKGFITGFITGFVIVFILLLILGLIYINNMGVY